MAAANFIGVYSSSIMPAAKKNAQVAPRKRYWFVWEDGWGRYRVQLLDAAYSPLDTPRVVSKKEFESAFVYEPKILVTPISRLEVEDDSDTEYKTIERPEAAKREEKQPRVEANSRADLESASILDHSLRGEFAVALAKLKRGDRAGATSFFEKLSNRTEGIIPAHKHMFTDFGSDLRKSKLPGIAFKFYQRALELAPDDANAYFNMARIMFELGDYNGCKDYLEQALKLNENFEEANLFIKYLNKHIHKHSPKKTDSKNNLTFNLK